ncbi:HAD family phosphatase [Bifidobacterium sp. ESL0763]|uniref:HAD family hydrolase n=1 Tax=Bifidobacterium sp. ESL0763 TaxID=2983227 RepID=UPI0023F8C444|nr:HAD family phosphatase [Bifidobacterium sp. ESL0763]MDF7663741.1 HAD family phosphatase [Bifidobacterium sp. ESL0763]
MDTNEGKAAIFDLDGTLLDSMDVWHQVDVDFFASRGLTLTDDYMNAVSAMKPDEVARYTIERYGLDDVPGELSALWDGMVLEAYGSTVEAKPHAVEYLDHLKASGAKLAVATSLSPKVRGVAMRHVGIDGCFDEVVSVEDTQAASKSSPEVYLLAASRLGVRPEDCTVFEDLLTAVRTAKAAGMHVWAMEDSYSAGNRPAIARIADGVIDDFDDAPRTLL